MKPLVALLVFAILSAELASAAAPFTAVEKGDPVVSTAILPARPHTPRGQVSLFADFDKKDINGVPLYFVNRTSKSVIIFTHRTSGVPFFLMEYQATPGKWKPAHEVDYPQCGFDMKSVTLPSESFLLVKGRVAYSGFKATVRYRLDKQSKPISNVGEGLVSHDDLTFVMLTKTRDFALVSKIAMGEYVPPSEVNDFRRMAIWQLAWKFDAAKSRPVLKRIAEGSDKESAKAAKDALQHLRQFDK